MTPKEEAKELFDKFKVIELSPKEDICKTFKNLDDTTAKKCALMCVDKIIESLEIFGYTGTFYDHRETGKMILTEDISPEKYWNDVKQEIEKL